MKTIATYLALAAMVILTGCASVKDGAAPSATGNEQAAAETAAAGQTGAEQAGEGQDETDPAGKEAAAGENAALSDTSAETARTKETVTIVIPTVYESVTTQEEAEKIRKENGYESAVLNADGSLTIVMSREQYEEMLEKFKKSVDEGIAEIIGAVEDSAIEKIEYNDDYSIFTVTVTGDEVGFVERQAADELVMYGTLYHIYTGNDATHIQVDYIASGTGEVLETADSGSLENAY